MKDQPIIVGQVFDTPISNVWRVITNNDEIKKWYFNLPEFKVEVGLNFQFTGGSSPEKQYVHL